MSIKALVKLTYKTSNENVEEITMLTFSSNSAIEVVSHISVRRDTTCKLRFKYEFHILKQHKV